MVKKLSCINPVSHIFKMFLWITKDVVQNLLKIKQYLLVAQKHESNIRSFVYSYIGHIIAVDLLACFKIYSLIFRTSSSYYASFSSIFSSSFYAKCTKLIPAADLERGRAWATDWRRHLRYSWYVTALLYYGDTVATLSLQKRKTWYSEYLKGLPPVALWQL